MAKLNPRNDFEVTSVEKGVYLDLLTITAVENLSNHPNYDKETVMFKNGKPAQLWLKIIAENENNNTVTFNAMGNYELDQSGNISGWSNFNNTVMDLFIITIGIANTEKLLPDTYQITDEMCNQLIGKKFYKVSYIIGIREYEGRYKGIYKDWNKIFMYDPSANKQDVIEMIRTMWFNSLKYLKSYKPDAYDELKAFNDTFNYNYDATEKSSEPNYIKYNNNEIEEDDVI